jgi:nitronate monooxygenase
MPAASLRRSHSARPACRWEPSSFRVRSRVRAPTIARLFSHARQARPLTRGFTGRLARGIKNQLLDELSKKETEILPYPLQRALVRHLSIPAEKVGRRELLPLWAGQSARLSHCEDVNVLLSNLVTQVSEIAGSVQRWGAAGSSQSQPKTP